MSISQEDYDAGKKIRDEIGWAEATMATPEQLLTFLRRCPDSLGLRITEQALRQQDAASRCWIEDHDGRLAWEPRAAWDRSREPFLKFADLLGRSDKPGSAMIAETIRKLAAGTAAYAPTPPSAAEHGAAGTPGHPDGTEGAQDHSRRNEEKR